VEGIDVPSFSGGGGGTKVPVAVKYGGKPTHNHQFTGSVFISGSLYAHEYNVDSITKTVTNIDQSGSTKFGDSTDDIHQFTGSYFLSGTAKVNGNFLPSSDNTNNLGSSTYRWANIYTGDLHLKNDRGDWTVLEEEEFLSIRNNKTGQLYKLEMTPINDPGE
jgi:hypothetical protein